MTCKRKKPHNLIKARGFSGLSLLQCGAASIEIFPKTVKPIFVPSAVRLLGKERCCVHF